MSFFTRLKDISPYLSLLILLTFISCGGSLSEERGYYSSKRKKSKSISAKGMDGVEYHIQKNINEFGLDKEHEKFEPSSKELRTALNSKGKTWNPTKRGFDIPHTNNANVERWIKAFTGPLRKNFKRWITRGSHYVPVMQDILKQHGVPNDLIYLSMIESGFNLHAYSHAHAAGPWQFIRSTGKLYGLKVDNWVDERRNLVMATDAAARHLKDLHKMYGDWYLAFAAYNAGPGKVNRAIRRSGSRNFWKIAHPRKRYIWKETKDYVPKILAAATIMKNYKKYGFSSSLFESPLAIDVVDVPDATDISVIADASGATVADIELLNSGLRRGVTPPGKSYKVIIPKGRKRVFNNRYAKVSGDDRVKYIFHRVRGRESSNSIANRYGVPKSELMAANNSRFKTGDFVKIPKKSGESTRVFLANKGSRGTYYASSGKSTTYRVRRGDTLSKIAKRFGVRLSHLKRWNRIGSKNIIRPGQRLQIRGSAVASKSTSNTKSEKTSIYRVRRGDTLGLIAQRHGLRLSQLKRDNGLRSNRIKVGQRLKIRGGSASSVVSQSSASKAVRQTSTYRVRRGDTLGLIAQRHGLRLSQLKEDNGLRSNHIKVGQILKIRTSGAATAKVANKSTNSSKSKIYRVRRGDSLGLISQKFGVRISQIKSANGLRSNKIKVGQELKIPSGSSRVAVSQVKSKYRVYRVQRGDTLWRISRKYGVSVSQIKKWNALRSNNLKLNQKIKIYS